MNDHKFSPELPGQRIISIDILRGFALLGILIMNIQSFSMPGPAYINPTAYGDLNGANKWVWILSHLLASEKFMSIFSMLFGAGVLIFTQRAEARSANSAVLHYRRMGWLFLFGLIHAYLLWQGDILVCYALCGILVFLFRKKSARTLLRWSLAFFIVPILLKLVSAWSMPYWPEESVNELRDSWAPGNEIIAHELEVFRSGWLAQMELRVPGSLFMQTTLFFIETFWRVTSMMLLGMALYKWKVFSSERPARFYFYLAVIGLTIGFLLSATGMALNFSKQWTLEYSMFTGTIYNYIGSVAVALGYVALVMSWCKRARATGVLMASVGRMAFSNYILMTLLGTLIFYGHGFGLFGSLEHAGQILLVMVIWVPVLLFSYFWLRRFKYGPLEALWRKLTYL